ncbi:helix-turn-helix domain-containing protein [Kitasatospora aburaviensis]|uniref:ArsR/SmtB family transcription factor n=1 Tax=Kitasatospora aburaviensis TaxID=67265 RepID=A0ABW1F490_9ACTN
MLRIHFTTEDLARTVLAGSRALPVAEAVMSLQAIRLGSSRRLTPWRSHVLERLPEGAALLGALVPASGWIPDFLTPSEPDHSGPAAFEAIRSTPRGRLAADLQRLSSRHRLPLWTRSLAEGDRAALNAVTDALETYHNVAIVPFADQIRKVLEADRAWRMHTIARGGLGAVLAGLHPQIHWREPVLELPGPRGAGDVDFRLEGRGILLCPHVFCGPRPRALLNDVDRPVLVYRPVWDPGGSGLVGGMSRRARPTETPALGTLLGRTRAAVLATLATSDGHTTKQLAESLAIAPASASEHVAALRASGLATSRRHANTMRHTITRLGIDLIAAGNPTDGAKRA